MSTSISMPVRPMELAWPWMTIPDLSKTISLKRSLCNSFCRNSNCISIPSMATGWQWGSNCGVCLAPRKPAALATSKRLPLGSWSVRINSMVAGEQKMMPVARAVRKLICLWVISRMMGQK